MKRAAAIGAAAIGAAAVSYLLRRQFVQLLTATTGTWVGSPPPPASRPCTPPAPQEAG